MVQQAYTHSRRERIGAAVVAGGRHARRTQEACIAADPFRVGFRVLIAGPTGFREESSTILLVVLYHRLATYN
jgi:hypothetical protein